MTVKKLFTHAPTRPDKSATSGGVSEHRSGSNRQPKRPGASPSGKFAFGGGSLSRPVGGKSTKKYI
jgi:hypothetical protein